jgi:hypothetical protein
MVKLREILVLDRSAHFGQLRLRESVQIPNHCPTTHKYLPNGGMPWLKCLSPGAQQASTATHC